MGTLTTFLPAKAVRERYSISDMSLWRWLQDPKLAFPKPIYIRGRRFWRLSDLEHWEADRADGTPATVISSIRITNVRHSHCVAWARHKGVKGKALAHLANRAPLGS